MKLREVLEFRRAVRDFDSARKSFNPELGKGVLTGFGWGMAGAVVDTGFDIYENSLYDDTLKYFRDVLSSENKNSKGINIIAKTK